MVLTLATCAVLAGATSYAQIWQWACDLSTEARRGLGLPDRLPCESTIRRVLQVVDPDVLDGVLCAWVAARRRRGGAATAPGAPAQRRVLAVDGKTARGARCTEGALVHLMAAVEHGTGTVLAQTRVDGKSNEINAFRPLLDRIDLSGAVVTADALHTQRAHVAYLQRHGARYVFTVKANQPRLLAQLTRLPWQDIPAVDTTVDKAHGRVETRQVKATRVRAGITFPGARLAIQITRTRRAVRAETARREVVYAVTDLDYDQITAAELAAIIRGHWTIENRLHWVRDVTFAEDRCQARTGHAAQVLATLRNTAINIHRRAGATNIATACRAITHRPTRLATLIT